MELQGEWCGVAADCCAERDLSSMLSDDRCVQDFDFEVLDDSGWNAGESTPLNLMSFVPALTDSAKNLPELPAWVEGRGMSFLEQKVFSWMRKLEAGECGGGNVPTRSEVATSTILEGTAACEAPNMKNFTNGIVLGCDVRTVAASLAVLCEASCKQNHAASQGVHLVNGRPTLVLCRKRHISGLVGRLRECARTPVRILVYTGRGHVYLSPVQLITEYDYVLSTYSTLRREPDPRSELPGKLHMVHWNRVVLVNPYFLNDFTCTESYLCTELRSEYRWVCAPDHLAITLDALYGYIRFLNMPLLKSWETWNNVVVKKLDADATGGVSSTELLCHVVSTICRQAQLTDTGKENGSCYDDEKVVKVDLSKDTELFYTATMEMAIGDVNSSTDQQTSCRPVLERLKLCRLITLHPCVGCEAYQMMNPILFSSEEREEHLASFLNILTQNGMRKETFSQELTKKLRTGVMDEDCGICFLRVNTPAILPCAHYFCVGCVDKIKSDYRSKCPHCRVPFSSRVVVPRGLLKCREDEPVPSDFSEWSPSPKAEVVIEQLENLSDIHKVIVFCCSRKFLEYLLWCLQRRGFSSRIYDDNRGMRETEKVTRWFSDEGLATGAREGDESGQGPRTLLVLLSHLDGETRFRGVTHCFFMHAMWCPIVEDRALGCVARGCGEEAVNVVRIFANVELEDRVHELCMRKRANGANHGVSSSEVFEVFNYAAHGDGGTAWLPAQAPQNEEEGEEAIDDTSDDDLSSGDEQ